MLSGLASAQKKASATSSSLIINEIMASNVDEFISPAYNFDGWIEFYNPTDEAVGLAGLYLSDDAKNLTKWQIPVSVGSLKPKAFRALWFDSNNIEPKNAPFKLDVDGGTIYVQCADVPKPVAVRYSFRNWMGANLEKTPGIPIPPFRTDDWSW